MWKLRCIGIGVLMLAALLLLAACGGDDKKDDQPQGGEQPGVVETPRFPPTWTPAPTLTRPPHVTVDYTYEAPESSPGAFATGSFPTRAPVTPPAPELTIDQAASPAPTSSAPLPNELTVTADLLNDLVGIQFNAIAGGFFEAAPVIAFSDGLIRASLTVYTTPADDRTARPVMIEASAAIEQGRVVLTPENVVFADDSTPYEDPLAGFILGAIDTALNDLVNQLYVESNPTAAGAYTLTSVTVAEAGVLVKITSE